MEEKCTFDLVTLLRAHKPITCNITYKGVDNSFGVYQHALTSYFSHNSLIWKRNGKAFPYRLTIPIKFVSFEESLCWRPDAETEKLSDLAYLHIFFISTSSVEDYRTTVRHNVSEWFSKVSSKADVQWFIVVDSTRAKEKKNRNSLMEKLKSDFNRHTSRLIEVSESVEHGSFTGLAQTVHTALLSHLDLIVNAWENDMGKARDCSHESTWNMYNYFTSTTEYARFFWSLGALEHALTIFDDLDRFLSTIVHFSYDVVPDWLFLLRSSKLSTCPTISVTINRILSNNSDNYTLLDLRHYLLTQQISLCLHLNHMRARSRGAAPSLRSDFAGLILKYTQHAHQTIREHSELLNLPLDSKQLSCWTILLVGEALHISGLLAGSTTIEEAASPSLCQLHTSRFHAILALDSENSQSDLVQWLLDSKLKDNFLSDVLQNKQLFSTQLQKIHDITNSILTQCGRKRTCAYIGGLYSQWLRKENRIDPALPYHLRFVNEIIENGCTSAKALEEVKQVTALLNPEHDFNRILSLLFFVITNSNDEEERLVYSQKILDHLSNKSGGLLSVTSLSPSPSSLFKCYVKKFSPNVQLPNGLFEIDVEVESLFPLSIQDCKITVQMREIDAGYISRRRNPVFHQNFSSRDNATRVLAIHRGHAFDRPTPATPSAAVVELTETKELIEGLTKFSLSSSIPSRGCYALENIRVSIAHDSLCFDFPSDYFDNHVPIFTFVQSSPSSITVIDGSDLLAGVVQSVDIVLESGTNIQESTILITTSDDSTAEFLTPEDKWENSLTVAIPPIQTDQSYRFTIQLCVPMDSAMTESPAVRKVKFSFEWQGRTWSYDLSFVALLILSSKTTLLENKVLYELEVTRALADEWTVIFESAVLSIDGPESEPPIIAKLLNSELEDLIPNIVSTLLWVLPQEGEIPILHKLDIKYKVKSSKNDQTDFVDHTYSYHADVQLKVPKIAYELCTQMLSHQPGAQLCRAGSPCDLVVSLRSLNHSVEMLYIVLDADSNLWTLNERAKVLQVKESGLGQMAFSVVPCAAGYLPYPSVSVYSCINVGGRSLESGWSEGIDIVPGCPLISFQRTAGKQIRVLAASQTETQTNERKAGLKQKIVKLFD